MKKPNESRMVLRYDSGGRGFKKAAYFLVITAIIVLALGVYFIYNMFL